jgi:hypothetical protein
VKRLWSITAVAIALSACSQSGASTSDTPITAPLATTTTVVATTTVAPLLNAASGEKAIACDSKAVSALYGEKIKLEKCTSSWAFGDTDRDSWNCPDTGCAHTRLFHLENNTWVNTASCQRTLPLTRYAMSCYIPNVGAATLAQLPPSDVACLIWPANTLLKYTAETGCTPSKADIIAQMNGACTGYYDAVEFPIEKCDQGRAIRLMQERLKKAGYNTNVDGYFGPSMAKAVYDFQGTEKLQQTGMIDQATWLALEPNQSSLPGTDANADGVVGPNELK